MAELLAYLVRALVEHPEQVRVEQLEEPDGTVVLELGVADEDYGRLIGRGGRTVRALRTIIKAVGAHEQRRVLLDVID